MYLSHLHGFLWVEAWQSRLAAADCPVPSEPRGSVARGGADLAERRGRCTCAG